MNLNDSSNVEDLPEFRYPGARVLVILHDEQMRRFLEIWRIAKSSGIKLPRVDNPDYLSYETLLAHVFRWARTYLKWICEQSGLPDPEIKTVPDTNVIESEAESYLEIVLNAWKKPLCEVEKERFFKPEYLSPWGVKYSIEAMLEHAVMHPFRHRYQLEKLLSRASMIMK